MPRAVAALLSLVFVASAQTNPAALAARQWREQHERAILDEFMSLLSIPNVSSDHANVRRNAEAVAKILEKRGITPKLVEIPQANPVVFGEIRTPGATRTIVFYAHYDGQPLDPKEWVTPPFSPVLRDRSLEKDGQVIPLPSPGSPIDPEWRIYARSASDDKAPIIALAAAIDAIRAAGLRLKSNARFVFEGAHRAVAATAASGRPPRNQAAHRARGALTPAASRPWACAGGLVASTAVNGSRIL